MLIPLTEDQAVSHTPALPFPLALRSPFILPAFAAFPAPAALCGKLEENYSLFLNGFAHSSMASN